MGQRTRAWGGAGRLVLLTGVAFLAQTAVAAAQADILDQLIPAGGASVTGRVVQLVLLLTVLSVAPGLLIMVTSFTRFVIALSFLRSGLGLPSTPANLVLISLSLFMTFYVMSPTFNRAWQDGVKPLLDNKVTEEEAYPKITEPFRTFMLTQVRPKDLALFVELAKEPRPRRPDDLSMRVVIPAYILSELKAGFAIGAVLFLPFLLIDMVTAAITTSIGMFQLPPVVVSTPLKILLFVMVDGWNLLAKSLLRSF